MLAPGTKTKEPGNGGKEQAAGGTMRLTCPNCGAQYEVPDAVIPVSGRDVQCSNCGTTWFQNHSDHTPPRPPEPEDMPEPAPGPEPAPAPEPERTSAAQRRLDPSVAEILRQEAERERAARAAEADTRIGTQPDLDLGEPEPDQARRTQEARARIQHLRGDQPADNATAPADRGTRDDDPDEIFDDEKDERLAPGSRHNLFPDIDEINSSLNSSEDAAGPLAPTISEYAPPARDDGGFRTGFRLAVVICVAALVIYLMAPQISALWPASKAPLTQYVQALDNLRAALSATVSALF
jgi:predicted Zn finger-like uncharacterized protein